MRASRDSKDQSAREAATAIASTLVPKTITVSAKASSEGKLFGSIHAAEIAVAIKAQTDIDIDRKSIEADHNIKTTGQHTVTASLHHDVSFPITLEVVAAD
jgi:large subunit ribosomal protein L9